MARSLRFTAFEFDPSKYDAMLLDVNNLDNDSLAGISGLSSARAVRTLENRMRTRTGQSLLASVNT